MAIVTKSITTDFGGSFDMHIFYREIQIAIGTPANALSDRTLNWIRTDGDVVSTDFDAVLDGPETTAFDAIVAAHPSFTVRQGDQRKVYTATVPPAVTDDANEGVDVGDVWIDTQTQKSYDCADTTVGAAVWKLLAPESGASTVDPVDPTANDDTASGFNVGDTWVNSTTGNAFILVDGTTANAVWRPVTPHVMGGFIVKGESLPVTTTNSTDFIQKLRITSPTTIEAGDYVLYYQYQWNIDTTSQNFTAQIQMDDTTVLFTHVEEATDSTGDWESTGSAQRMPVSGFKFVTLSDATPVEHTFDLDFKSPSSNFPASMWNAQMFLQRISGDPVS